MAESNVYIETEVHFTIIISCAYCGAEITHSVFVDHQKATVNISVEDHKCITED